MKESVLFMLTQCHVDFEVGNEGLEWRRKFSAGTFCGANSIISCHLWDQFAYDRHAICYDFVSQLLKVETNCRPALKVKARYENEGDTEVSY